MNHSRVPGEGHRGGVQWPQDDLEVAADHAIGPIQESQRKQQLLGEPVCFSPRASRPRTTRSARPRRLSCSGSSNSSPAF